ncbi:MAG: hypothetical protein ABJQ70_09855 [Roseobacter sp.]
MYPNQPQNQMGQSPLTNNLQGCALVAAGTGAFFGTPPLYSSTVNHVIDFSTRHYGQWNGLEDLISISWWLLVAVALFMTGRFVFAALFMMMASRFFSRFL